MPTLQNLHGGGCAHSNCNCVQVRMDAHKKYPTNKAHKKILSVRTMSVLARKMREICYGKSETSLSAAAHFL